jgi:hypothetical protein
MHEGEYIVRIKKLFFKSRKSRKQISAINIRF